jgi:hypothetical protein
MTQTRTRIALLALIVVAVVLRLSTLSVQSYWDDEAATLYLLKLGFWKMLETIPKTESTPPLYYVIAWPWTRLFGMGEFGARSLSALAGIGTVLLTYGAAAHLVSRRAALVATALVAFNPLLIWYSQEARSYALYTFLAALSFFFFVRYLRYKRVGTLWCWGIASGLALISHYFAIFLVVPEAVWLVVRARQRITALFAVALVVAIGLALLPLVRHQQDKPELAARRVHVIREDPSIQHAFGHSEIGGTPLTRRVLRIPKQFLVGPNIPAERAFTLLAGLTVIVAVTLLIRCATFRERRGARIAAGIGLAMIATPVALAAFGADYILPYYLIAAVVPWAIVIAAGFAATRTGLAIASVLCLVSLALVLIVATMPRYQRENWRGAAQALGSPRRDRAIVVTPSDIAILWFDTPLPLYQAGLRRIAKGGEDVRELDVLTVRAASGPLPRRLLRVPSDSFSLVERVDDDTFTLLRFVSPRRIHVTRLSLVGIHLGDWPPHRVTVFTQHTLTLRNSTVSGNSASSGEAFGVLNSGTLEVMEQQRQRNSASGFFEAVGGIGNFFRQRPAEEQPGRKQPSEQLQLH